MRTLPQSKDEMDEIAYMMLTAMKGKHQPSLEIEILWSAMHFLKQYPNSTIKDACSYGINEWLK